MYFGLTIVDEKNPEIISDSKEIIFSANFSTRGWGRKWVEKLIRVEKIQNKAELFLKNYL